MDRTDPDLCAPIGVVHSPLQTREEAPPQPGVGGDEVAGTVEVFEEFADGLDGIERYDRIWLITWLHRADPARLRLVPRNGTAERGVFATRAPNRPNPIGLTPVRLLRREGRILHVAGLDLLDGTPVLDLKPYSRGIDAPDAGDIA